MNKLSSKKYNEQFFLRECEQNVTIEDYTLKTHQVHFVTHLQKGFVGTCTYQMRNEQEHSNDATSLSVRQQILLLARLAFYTGVGYKPAMGMGQCRCL